MPPCSLKVRSPVIHSQEPPQHANPTIQPDLLTAISRLCALEHRAIPFFPSSVCRRGGPTPPDPPNTSVHSSGSSTLQTLHTLQAPLPSSGRGRHFVGRWRSLTLEPLSRGRAVPPGQLRRNDLPLLGCSGANPTESAWFFSVASDRVEHRAPPLLLSRLPRQSPRPWAHPCRLAVSEGLAIHKWDQPVHRILILQYPAIIRLGSGSERSLLCRSPGASVN